MKVLATCKPVNYRRATHSYGVLAEIDWDAKAIVRALRIPTASFQDGAAFMTCFLQGMCLVGRRVFVAAWNFIVEIDYNTFQVVNAVSWPPMADLHGMTSDGARIWVASTAIDAVLGLNAATLELEWRWGPDEPILRHGRRELPLLGRANNGRFVEREYRYVHKSTSPYHQHHLNDVTLHDGLLYVTTKGWNKRSADGAVIELDPHSGAARFFVEPGQLRGTHDTVFRDGRMYVTESGANTVAWREPNGQVAARPVEPAPRFVRGLCDTGSSFLVGFTPLRESASPATIVEYDYRLERQLSSFDLCGLYPPEHGTAIHTLALAPE